MAEMMDAAARKQFKEQLLDGAALNCPCCDRHAQVYRRRLHKSVAVALIRLYKLALSYDPGYFFHVSELVTEGMSGIGDFSKAKYWHLIEADDNDDPAKKTSGNWRLTPRGVSFVKGELGITEYAMVYDDRVLEYRGKTIYIHDSLSAEFNYTELMENL
jgi:hypothetical protein